MTGVQPRRHAEQQYSMALQPYDATDSYIQESAPSSQTVSQSTRTPVGATAAAPRQRRQGSSVSPFGNYPYPGPYDGTKQANSRDIYSYYRSVVRADIWPREYGTVESKVSSRCDVSQRTKLTPVPFATLSPAPSGIKPTPVAASPAGPSSPQRRVPKHRTPLPPVRENALTTSDMHFGNIKNGNFGESPIAAPRSPEEGPAVGRLEPLKGVALIDHTSAELLSLLTGGNNVPHVRSEVEAFRTAQLSPPIYQQREPEYYIYEPYLDSAGGRQRGYETAEPSLSGSTAASRLLKDKNEHSDYNNEHGNGNVMDRNGDDGRDDYVDEEPLGYMEIKDPIDLSKPAEFESATCPDSESEEEPTPTAEVLYNTPETPENTVKPPQDKPRAPDSDFFGDSTRGLRVVRSVFQHCTCTKSKAADGTKKETWTLYYYKVDKGGENWTVETRVFEWFPPGRPVKRKKGESEVQWVHRRVTGEIRGTRGSAPRERIEGEVEPRKKVKVEKLVGEKKKRRRPKKNAQMETPVADAPADSQEAPVDSDAAMGEGSEAGDPLPRLSAEDIKRSRYLGWSIMVLF